MTEFKTDLVVVNEKGYRVRFFVETDRQRLLEYAKRYTELRKNKTCSHPDCKNEKLPYWVSKSGTICGTAYCAIHDFPVDFME